MGSEITPCIIDIRIERNYAHVEVRGTDFKQMAVLRLDNGPGGFTPSKDNWDWLSENFPNVSNLINGHFITDVASELTVRGPR